MFKTIGSAGGKPARLDGRGLASWAKQQVDIKSGESHRQTEGAEMPVVTFDLPEVARLQA